MYNNLNLKTIPVVPIIKKNDDFDTFLCPFSKLFFTCPIELNVPTNSTKINNFHLDHIRNICILNYMTKVLSNAWSEFTYLIPEPNYSHNIPQWHITLHNTNIEPWQSFELKRKREREERRKRHTFNPI